MPAMSSGASVGTNKGAAARPGAAAEIHAAIRWRGRQNARG